jgi:hypothetical protein
MQYRAVDERFAANEFRCSVTFGSCRISKRTTQIYAIALLRTNALFYQEIEGLKEVLSVDCESANAVTPPITFATSSTRFFHVEFTKGVYWGGTNYGQRGI